MNYKIIYDKIIAYRKLNKPLEYSEKHHIIPRSLGGTNMIDNLVKLTAREHFICHLLLTKIYKEGTGEWYKMIKAFSMMSAKSSNQQRYYNNKWYEYLKVRACKAMKLAQSGSKNSKYGTCWVFNPKTLLSKQVKKENLSCFIKAGWEKGKIEDKNRYLVCKRIGRKHLRKYESDLLKQGKGDLILSNEQKRMIKDDNIFKKIQLYSRYYEVYKEKGYKGVVDTFGYTSSKVSLVRAFNRYVSSFVPKANNKHTVGR